MTSLSSAPLSIADSLHASRRTLLHDAFPPFPSSTPHHLRPLGSATVSIGPHFFPSTSLFLAEWTGPSTSSSAPAAGGAHEAAGEGTITPALIARLNAASQSDPALAEIMRKAATNQAAPEELSHLARYIETLRESAGEGEGAGAKAEGALEHPSVVLQFKENEGQKFVLPAHVLYTPLAAGTVSLPFPPSPPSSPSASTSANPAQAQGPGGAEQDVLLSLFLFPSSVPSLVQRHAHRVRAFPAPAAADLAAAAGVVPLSAPVPVDVVVHRAGQGVREGLWRAARNARGREEKVEGWWKQMVAATPPRTHVLHIPPPPLASSSSLPFSSTALPPGGGGADTPLSSGLSRTASEAPVLGAVVASGSGLGSKRGGTPSVAAGGPPAKKQKAAPKKKAAPRPSASRARSKPPASASASVAGTPLASTPAAAAAASPSIVSHSPGPSSLAGSPAPEAMEVQGGGKKKAAPAKKGAKGKGKGKGKAKQEEPDEQVGAAGGEAAGEGTEEPTPQVVGRRGSTRGRPRVKYEDGDEED
ncbi:hypothetical protein JCM6882_005021 [Rhodosporidiobolus microsporus]